MSRVAERSSNKNKDKTWPRQHAGPWSPNTSSLMGAGRGWTEDKRGRKCDRGHGNSFRKSLL